MSVITILLWSLCFFALLLLPSASGLVSDGITLLSLLSHWTFVPPIINSTWNPSDSAPCSWVGVECNHAHNVVSLNLTDHGILGQLGPEIQQLHHLQTLLLANNGFSGEVPSEISNCSLLQHLDLANNSFSGQIPFTFNKLQNLRFMSLSFNLLTGEIPDSLFQVHQLQELNLHSNHLSGPIPTSIGNLTQLLRLDLHGNRLTGTIPSSIGNCSKLEDLVLNENKLKGELPLEMAKLKHLKNILLFDNQLSGFIPQGLGINSSLVKLDLTMNEFTGNIPLNLCLGKQLGVLNLGSNQLQGSIPSDIGICETLSMLILSENHLIGSLPEFKSNLNLKIMDISRNRISGTIPSSLGKCTNLIEINLSMNKFTGLIPPQLGKLVNLEVLNLAHNRLEGALPYQLSNCTKMDSFDVGFNSLNGSILSSFRSWTGLTTLILRENHFTGGIPTFLSEYNKLHELQLGGNLFGGKIPPSLGKLKNLFYRLNLSANGLTGEIPFEIGKLKVLSSLDLSSNNLTGSIDVLGELSLINLNVSYNFFYGPVPETLMKFLNSSPSSFLGNPYLCVSFSPSHSPNSTQAHYLKPCVYKSTYHLGISIIAVVMIELGSAIFVSALLVALVVCRLNASLTRWGRHVKNENEDIIIQFPWNDRMLKDKDVMNKVDDGCIIGEGAHGIVYKVQHHGQVLAAKKSVFRGQGNKRLGIMKREIETLCMTRHRNLVKILGYALAKDYGVMFTEYMENGSLHHILHKKIPPPELSWNDRLKIADGVAHGLKYVHYDCDPPIVHRDIKPQNILLDADMEPHISDFGIANIRNLAEDSYTRSDFPWQKLSVHIAGTAGYMAPECAYATVPSRSFDVYSYGVVLLELITRKSVLVDGKEHIVSWVRSIWDDETNKIDKIVDSYLAAEFPDSAVLKKQVTAVLLLALRCTERDQRNRPTMIDVVNFYRKIPHGAVMEDFNFNKLIWKNLVPPEVEVLVWMVMLETPNTRHIPSNLAICPMCQQEPEELRCDHMVNDNNDGAEVSVGVAPQQPFNNDPIISTNQVSNTQDQGDSYVNAESKEPQDAYASDDLKLVSAPKTGVGWTHS
ncbi:hypothetical protein PIB30_038591 [Stylosanthes scabra]|uniref:Protein kinase domain-containing protein n=1 Tax=Stylosanthes scabra TaxID=79078 RepID=A0ABU6QEQ3_9FABA|nr:hypothetical protein [Stylosanthes scabra]